MDIEQKEQKEEEEEKKKDNEGDGQPSNRLKNIQVPLQKCHHCGQDISLTEKGVIKMHYHECMDYDLLHEFASKDSDDDGDPQKEFVWPQLEKDRQFHYNCFQLFAKIHFPQKGGEDWKLNCGVCGFERYELTTDWGDQCPLCEKSYEYKWVKKNVFLWMQHVKSSHSSIFKKTCPTCGIKAYQSQQQQMNQQHHQQQWLKTMCQAISLFKKGENDYVDRFTKIIYNMDPNLIESHDCVQKAWKQ